MRLWTEKDFYEENFTNFHFKTGKAYEETFTIAFGQALNRSPLNFP